MSTPDREANSAKPEEFKKFSQYLAAILATVGSISAGTYLSWTSPALPLYGKNGAMDLTDKDKSWVASLLPLGALVGALPAGMIADKLGRKIGVLIIAVPLLLCWFSIGFAPNTICLFGSRFLAGAAIGATSVIVPLYVSEISHPAIRGSLGSLFQLQITIGVCLGYLTGIIGDLRYIALASAVVPAIVLASFPFMPETPVWLMRQNRREDATKVMQWLRGEHYAVREELEALDRAQISQGLEKAKISDLKNHKKAVLISLGLMVFQQMSGINAIVFFASQIVEQEGSAISPNVCTVILGVAQVIATYFAGLLVDRAGRKILLIASSSVMALCLFVVAGYLKFKDPSAVGTPWIPLISLTIYMIMFATGFGPIPWIMVSELCPTNVVGIISSVSAALNWSLAFTVTNIFTDMTQTLGAPLSFCLFAVIGATGSIFVATVIPETKGKTKEEIQIALHGIPNPPSVKLEKEYVVRQTNDGVVIETAT